MNHLARDAIARSIVRYTDCDLTDAASAEAVFSAEVDLIDPPVAPAPALRAEQGSRTLKVYGVGASTSAVALGVVL